jgi:hypothetical protein
MPFFYQTGEKIAEGDLVVYAGNTAEVEFVADPTDSPEDWYVKQFGGGIMIREPKVFGSVFLHGTEIGNDEDLVFVSRKSGSKRNSG